MTVVYILEGAEITSLEEFWRVIGEEVNGPGGYFGSNLDAFNDCLRRGFGTPEDGDFAIEWRDHEISRRNLGYAETVRQLQIRLCIPDERLTLLDRRLREAVWADETAGASPWSTAYLATTYASSSTTGLTNTTGKHRKRQLTGGNTCAARSTAAARHH